MTDLFAIVPPSVDDDPPVSTLPPSQSKGDGTSSLLLDHGPSGPSATATLVQHQGERASLPPPRPNADGSQFGFSIGTVSRGPQPLVDLTAVQVGPSIDQANGGDTSIWLASGLGNESSHRYDRLVLLGPASVSRVDAPSHVPSVDFSVRVGSTIVLDEEAETDVGIVMPEQPVLFTLVPSRPLPAHTAFQVTSDQDLSSTSAIMGCDVIPARAQVYDYGFSTPPPPLDGLYFTRTACTVVYIFALFPEGAVMHNVSWHRVLSQQVNAEGTTAIDMHNTSSSFAVLYLEDGVDLPTLGASVTATGPVSGTVSLSFGAHRPPQASGIFSGSLHRVVTPTPGRRVDWLGTVVWREFPLNVTGQGVVVDLTSGAFKVTEANDVVNISSSLFRDNSFVALAIEVQANSNVSSSCIYIDSDTASEVNLQVDATIPSFPFNLYTPPTVFLPSSSLAPMPTCSMLQQRGVDTLFIVRLIKLQEASDSYYPLRVFRLDNQTVAKLPTPSHPMDPVSMTVPVVPGALSLRVDLPDRVTPYLVTLNFTTDDKLSDGARNVNLAPWGLNWLDDEHSLDSSPFGFMGEKYVSPQVSVMAAPPHGVVGGMSVLGTIDYGNFSDALKSLVLKIHATPIVAVPLDGGKHTHLVPGHYAGLLEVGQTFAALRIPNLHPLNIVNVTFSENLMGIDAVGCIGSLHQAVLNDTNNALPRVNPIEQASGRTMLITPDVSFGGAPDPDNGIAYLWLNFGDVMPRSNFTVTAELPRMCDEVAWHSVETPWEAELDCVGVYRVPLPRAGPLVLRIDTVSGGNRFGSNVTSSVRVGPPGYFPLPLDGLAYPSDWLYIPSGKEFIILHSPDPSGTLEPTRLRVSVEPEVQLCHPVLRCSGNGHCQPQAHQVDNGSPAEAMAVLLGESVCDCMSSFGFAFSGDHCERRSFGNLPMLLVPALLLAAAVASWIVSRSLFCRRCVRATRERRTSSSCAINGGGGDGDGSDEDDEQQHSMSPLLLGDDSPRLDWHLDPVRIDLHRVSLEVSDRQSGQTVQLLQDISVTLRPRTVTAIMGPSGSGKTTLLRLLAGWLTPTSGYLTLNRDAQLTAKTTLGDAVSLGFVPQEDILTPQLTVREALDHSARLRLPEGNHPVRRAAAVARVLDLLDLRQVADATIGVIGQSTLSGGQRRRVSIGLELVSRCSVLLLDEPTSGLSSLGSLQVMNVLAAIARTGVTVVAVIHQPRREILPSVDALLVLARGRLHFAGEPTADAALAALCDGDNGDEGGCEQGGAVDCGAETGANRRAAVTSLLRSGPGVNVADVIVDFVDVFRVVTAGTIERREREAEKERRRTLRQLHAVDSSSDEDDVTMGASSHVVLAPVLAQPRRPRRLGWLAQVALFARRATLQTLRSPGTLAVLYGLTLVVAVLLGGVFSGSRYVGPPLTALVIQCPRGFIGQCMLNQEDSYFSQGSMISLALGLAAIAAFLSTFGGIEKAVFLRESRTGAQSDSAYYLGKVIGETPHLLAAPLLFTVLFAWLSIPTAATSELYLVALGVFTAASGAAHVISIGAEQSRSLIYATVFVAVSVLLGGVSPSVQQIEAGLGSWLGTTIPKLSYAHWTIEAFYLSVVSPYQAIYDTAVAVEAVGMDMDEQGLALTVPLLMGLAFRLIGAIVLAQTDKLQFT